MTTCSIDGCAKTAKSRGWCATHYTRWHETGSTELGVRQRGNNRAPTTLAARFWPKVMKTDDCWLWTAGTTALGYGCIWSGGSRTEGTQLMAHRVSWELANGPIPEGLVIDHLCATPSCVRPDHLEPVSVAENTRRGYAPSIGASHQRGKTHCPQGHPYSPENTYTYGPRRVCRTCAITRTQERRRRAIKEAS